MSTPIKIDSITINIDLQQREDLYHPPTVQRYADLMSEGTEFPPVIVFDDGDRLLLGDGFQRVHAAMQAGLTEINADVRQGTERDALLFSAGANAAHGLQPTNADKRKAVTLLLKDPEWSQWSDRQIAKHIGVGNKFVSKMRRQMEHEGEIDIREEVMAVRGGRAYATKVNRNLSHDSPEQRMINRLIDRLGSVDDLVNILDSEFGASVSEHTSEPSVSGHTSGTFSSVFGSLDDDALREVVYDAADCARSNDWSEELIDYLDPLRGSPSVGAVNGAIDTLTGAELLTVQEYLKVCLGDDDDDESSVSEHTWGFMSNGSPIITDIDVLFDIVDSLPASDMYSLKDLVDEQCAAFESRRVAGGES